LGALAAPFAAGLANGQERPSRPVPPGKVKITGFDIHKVSIRWRDLMFLEVHTDAGLTGLGEATLESRTDIAEAALRWIEPELTGQDPAGPERHWNRLYYLATRWRNGPAIMTALSAVDTALWDIEAQRLGVPLARLLGGSVRDGIRVYYTHSDAQLGTKPRTPASMAEMAASTKERGWTAIKYSLPRADFELERMDARTAELEAIRKAVGTKFDIGLECAESFSVRSAIEMAAALAPYRPMFLEEPVLREIPGALGEVAAKSAVPIATGEGIFSRYEFKQLLDARGAAIIQPDVMHAGGITEMRKIAALAETYNVEVAPHQCSGPIAHVASMNVMSLCRNFVIHECEGADNDLFRELTGGTYPVQQNGYVRLPDAPGLGIRVDFAEFKRRCPYKGVRSRAMMPV
jgi:galactonate dehydratase